MQLNSAILDDLAKMASGAAGAAMDLRREMQSAWAAQVSNFLEKHNYVAKNEFETVRVMATKAREENEELKKRLAAVEARLSELASK